MTYIFGILVIVLGVFLVIKTGWFISNFGRSAWAEQHLGNGGTHLMYKGVGLIMIFGAMLIMTGLAGPLFLRLFGRLFGLS